MEGKFCAENSEFSEEEGRTESGKREGLRFGVRLIHGRDFNTSGKKAVSLESLDGLRCLKSFVLL